MIEEASLTLRESPLPISLPPRGLNRPCSAAYIGVSVGKFDEMVRDGRMPQSRMIDARLVWDRHQLDEAFSSLPSKDNSNDLNPWDAVV